MGLPCCVCSPCRHAVATTPADPWSPGCSTLFLPRSGLGAPRRRPSPLHHGVGIRERCFEACSAFTSLRPACLLNRLKRPFDIESFSRFVTASAVSTATGWNNPTSRAGLSPAGEQRLSTAHGARPLLRAITETLDRRAGMRRVGSIPARSASEATKDADRPTVLPAAMR